MKNTRMGKIKLITVLSIVLAIKGCKYCGNQNSNNQSFSLQLTKEEKELYLGNKSKPSIQITLTLTPHPEANKDIRFKISDISGINGRLVGSQGEEISASSEVKRGQNILTYEPNKLGEHDLKIEVSDEGGSIKESGRVRLEVKQKTVCFHMDLKETSGRKWFFPHEEAKLQLLLSPVDEEAIRLEYTIKSLRVEKGKLVTLGGGEELKSGDKIAFKKHDLVFVPSDELGPAFAQMTLENEENASKSASVNFDIKAVKFDLNTSLRLVQEGGIEQAQMSIEISGDELDNETFKVAEITFSDKKERSFQNQEGRNLVGFTLESTSKYIFYTPVEKAVSEVKMIVKLAIGGTIHEKTLSFSRMLEEGLAKKGVDTLQAIRQSLEKTRDILSLGVEEKNYQKTISAENEVKKEVDLLAQKIGKLEALGCNKKEIDLLKTAAQELQRHLDTIQDHAKKMKEKKFAFIAQLKFKENQIFSHEKAHLELDINSFEKENQREVYTIKTLSSQGGNVTRESGEEVKEGSRMIFGVNKLVFVPSEVTTSEVTKGEVEITLESDKGVSSQARASIEVKPVKFDLNASFKIARDKGELKVLIPATGSSLDKETFKVISAKLSNGVELSLMLPVSLKPGVPHIFSLPLANVSKEVLLNLSIEGPGGAFEKKVNYASLLSGALAREQMELSRELQACRDQASALLSKTEGSDYEVVLKGEKAIRAAMKALEEKKEKLVALGLEKKDIETIEKEIKGVEANLDSIESLKNETSKKKYAFDVRVVREQGEVFVHQSLPFSITLSAREEETKRLKHTIKSITATKGKVCAREEVKGWIMDTTIKQGAEIKEGTKVIFGENKFFYVPTELGEGEVALIIGNEKGVEEMVNIPIDIKPIDFKVYASVKDTQERQEAYGNLDVSVEAEKALQKDKFRVIGWRFEKDEKDGEIEDKMGQYDFEKFTESLCALVYGGKDEKKIESELVDIDQEKAKVESKQKDAIALLHTLQVQAEEKGRLLEGLNREEAILRKKIDGSSPSAKALTIAFKFDILDKIREAAEKKVDLEFEALSYSKEASLQESRIERDKAFAALEKSALDKRREELEARKKVFGELKKMRENQRKEMEPELLNKSREKRESYDLSVERTTHLLLKLPHASIPSRLILNTEGPGGVQKEAIVTIRDIVKDRIASKITGAITKLKELTKEMDMKAVGRSQYEELSAYLSALDQKIEETLAPLKASYGEDWWANPSLMEVRNLKELAEKVMETQKKKETLEEKKEEAYKAIFSFEVDVDFSFPKEEKVFDEDYLVMKVKLKIDETMKKKKWKMLNWHYSDSKARPILNTRQEMLSEFNLFPGEENVFYMKFPGVEFDSSVWLKLEVGAFEGDGKGLSKIISKEIKIELGVAEKMIFESKLALFMDRTKRLNEEIKKYVDSKNPQDKTFNKLTSLYIEAGTIIKYQEKQGIELSKKLGGSSMRDVAFMLSKGMKEKMIAHREVEIPKLERNKAALDRLKDGVTEAINKFSGGKGEVEVVENLDTPDDKGELLLHKMVRDPEVSMNSFEAILKTIPDINAKNKEGKTPFQILMDGKNKDKYMFFEKMELLVKAQARPDVKNKNGDTPLYVAAGYGKVEAVKALLEAGVDVNEKNQYNYTPLHEAALNGNVEVVGLLIAKGAIVRYKDGYTPLHYAAGGGHKAIVELLIAKGADVKVQNNDGDTPLHKAAILLEKDIAEILINHGAEVNIKNKDGETPLHKSASRNKRELAELLISRGADKYARNKYGDNPLERAQSCNKNGSHDEVIAVLSR